MDWKLIIQQLLDAGMTQQTIADACATNQSHISGIYRRRCMCPNWDLGERLRKLHERVMRKRNR